MKSILLETYEGNLSTVSISNGLRSVDPMGKLEMGIVSKLLSLALL